MPSTFEAIFVDERLKFMVPSTFGAVFMDGRLLVVFCKKTEALFEHVKLLRTIKLGHADADS